MYRIYVGNLPYSVDKTQLAEIFAPAGTVVDSAIPLNEDRRPRGFAFVSFETKEGMENAIKMFDGKDMGGRTLRVNEARPREDRDGDRPAPAPAKPKEESDDAPAEEVEPEVVEVDTADTPDEVEKTPEAEEPTIDEDSPDDAPADATKSDAEDVATEDKE